MEGKAPTVSGFFLVRGCLLPLVNYTDNVPFAKILGKILVISDTSANYESEILTV